MNRYVRGAFLTGVICLFLHVAPAHAALIMVYAEVGTDVTGTMSGSLDLSGMTASGLGFVQASVGVWPPQAGFGTGDVGDALTGFFDQISGPSNFGPGLDFVDASSSIGDAFFLHGAGSDFWVPAGYLSGSALNATQTFTNQTFASLGLALGTYVYTLDSGDTLTVRVGPAASIPEPASLLLLGTGLLGAGVRRWRRTRY